MAPTGSSQKSSATVWGATKRCVVPAGDAMAGHIAHLKDMGFCESQARKALAECVWDVNRAIDLLVSRGAAALAKPALPKAGAKESSGSSDHTEVVSNKGIDLDNSSTASGVSTPRCCASSVAPESGHGELKDDEERNKRSIRRVCRKVTSQDAQQLSADPGEFVRVWPFYETELGWIYAEDPTDASRAGWLPTAILESIEAGHEWVYVQKAMAALHANQVGVEEGEILKINLASRTPEGWVYAQKEKTEAGKVSGWVPVCSFVWNNPQ